MFNMQDKIISVIPTHLQSHAKETFEKYQINTVFRAIHFLSQVMHESGDFKRKEENLNYKDVNRLVQIFRADFDKNRDKKIGLEEIEFAKKYVGKPEAIANYVYANQNGNGNEASGDGWKYRGRGFIQLTGKSNYEALSKDFMGDFINNPHFVCEDKYAMLSAGWFWDKRKLNLIADKGLTEDVIKEITKKINGGLIGLSERIDKVNDICEKLQFIV